ncbi:uncharacterized protein LOC126769731 [Nymphalis io]|uniref:uncharacterized protein LOC126769731 n=1 Tax=Inachis io TaxID=171585 RepID=UPI00216A45CC|nr:uncharacterized protein LOC126769731 [Nymphalis io]
MPPLCNGGVPRDGGRVMRPTSVEELSGRMSRALKEVCDAAMPRTRRRAQRRHVYWWSPEIAELRATCNRVWWAYVRCRRRNGLDVDLEGQLLAAYYQLKKDLQLAISRAKEKARKEMLVSLNRNPWGRAYRGVRGKFRTQTTPVTESLPPELVLRLMAPRSVIEDLVAPLPPLIAEREMEMALGRLRTKNTAPVPDSVPGRVLCDALEYLSAQRAVSEALEAREVGALAKGGAGTRLLFDSRSSSRSTPRRGRSGSLGGSVRVQGGPFNDRRLERPEDSDHGSSGKCKWAQVGGQVVLAVSLDVANTFNSLPFETIREALRYQGVPIYLRRLLEA